MSFFIRNSKGNASVTQQRSKDRKKRKGTQPANRNDAKKAAGDRGAKANSKASEEILSSESDIEDRVVPGTHFSDDDEELETEQEKKLRLAKKYLAEIEKQEKERLEVEELDRSVLSHRLRNELLEQSGQLQKKVADKVEGVNDSDIKILRGHKLSVTCVTISHDEKHIFSGSKDCSIIKWCTRTGAKLHQVPGAKKAATSDQEMPLAHTGHVLALAVSSDGSFLVSAWSSSAVRSSRCTQFTFVAHAAGISFRSQMLVSARGGEMVLRVLDHLCVSLARGRMQMGCLTRPCIRASNLENAVRYAKEKDYLLGMVLRFVGLVIGRNRIGPASGLAKWEKDKNKNGVVNSCFNSCFGPLCKQARSRQGCTTRFIVIFRLQLNFKMVMFVQQEGFVNELVFGTSGQLLVAAVGQEHRLGRWWNLRKAKNCVAILPLKISDRPAAALADSSAKPVLKGKVR
ncbi:unnamed protein product [Ixodes persulcatus]